MPVARNSDWRSLVGTPSILLQYGCMILKIVIMPGAEGGLVVSVPRLPGCLAEGETHDQALANIRDAIELYLEMDDDIPLAAEAHIEEISI